MKLKKGFLKEHVSEHDANIRLEDYSTTLNEPEVNNCFSIYTHEVISAELERNSLKKRLV